MKALDIIALVLLAVALGFGGYLMWLNFPSGSESYQPYNANLSAYSAEPVFINVSNQITQFYPNMRYSDKKISYRLESACAEEKFSDIQKAFEILSERTILEFYQSIETPEIKVFCSEIVPEAEEKGHFIAGEGGPSEIINTTRFAVVLTGKIALYKERKCDEPKVAIHEILHALGFDHYNNEASILYPATNCEQQIDSEIIEIINKLYAVDSLPDLVIESIEADREGRYLNFNANVSNIGLIKSHNVQLNLLVNGEKIENFTLEDLDVGEKKILSVENARIPTRINSIVFIVESKDIGELSFENNRADIYDAQ